MAARMARARRGNTTQPLAVQIPILKVLATQGHWQALYLIHTSRPIHGILACRSVLQPVIHTVKPSSSTAWPAAFALTALPISIRLAQSIKRYRDSRLFTHLINAGKYGLGVISYLFYYLWLHQGEIRLFPHMHNEADLGIAKHDDIWLPIWLIFMTFYSLYAITWDLLMDWSLLRRRSKHFLLRNELGYPTHKFAYYFAIVTNCIIRFVWLIYVPERGPNMILRQFIYGFLEMLRRAQWNFYRLENEHIGNLDQYRFASELPFPIAFNTTDTQSNNRSRHFSDTSVSPSDKE
ncbi:hypothetical protein NP233_g10081 [Leucocoprinus birnbaumii]|uniref:EXS domain-containing protein n=1 Tax=Leucocoprinus birnbaumii TaxID=56174 RepID=A0AAD5VJH0_9AGAR|nr:hypothetical protein NP233_g10081 [Leucocoprinus birnbaumii]